MVYQNSPLYRNYLYWFLDNGRMLLSYNDIKVMKQNNGIQITEGTSNLMHSGKCKIPKLDNGRTSPKSGVIQIGDYIYVSCSDGFIVNGIYSAIHLFTCVSNETFSQRMPICVKDKTKTAIFVK